MKKVYRLEGLDCAVCAEKIERAIAGLDGVTEAHVSFLTAKLTLEAPAERIAEIEEAARKCIRRIEPDTKLVAAH